MLRGRIGGNDHDDLAHMAGKDAGFGRREQGRRVEDDDPVRITRRERL